MTATARKVLADLEVSYELLEAEENVDKFRILWVASVSLARTVGHVLDKVDKNESPKLSSAISSTYQSWKQNPKKNEIFFQFIENERNSILKEYEFGFLSGPTDVAALPTGEIFKLDDNLFCPMSSGKYEGEDCRDILKSSITWWKQQLNAIESSVI